MKQKRPTKEQPRKKPGSGLFFVIWGLVIFAFTLLGLISPIALRPNIYSVSINQISQSDIQAPYTLEFISEIRTEEAKANAEQEVELVFSPVPSVRKTQIILLQSILDSITQIRGHSDYLFSDKSDAITALSEIEVSSDQIFQLINMSNEKWSILKEESIRVLNTVLSENIKEAQVVEKTNNLPIDYIKFSEFDNSLIVSLVKPFVVATYFYDSEATNYKRQAAIAAIEPVKVTKRNGEILVRKGQQITPEIYEALKAFNLVGGKTQWQDIVSAIALSITIGMAVILFFNSIPMRNEWGKSLIVTISTLYLAFLFSARFIVPNRAIVPFLFPIPAFGLLISIFFSPQIGILFSLCLSMLIGFNITSGVEISIFHFICSLCAILGLGKAKRVADFFLSGAIIGIVGSLIVISFRLPNPLNDWVGLLTLCGAAFACGIFSSSFALLLQFIISHMLGLPTPLRLIDLSRSDHPLLQYLLQNAPGTYQHSLLVSSMTEKAVSDIGGNALLARVGALYHDIGKAANAPFFIENQPPSKSNPHEKLSPEKSASIIIGHVTDGLHLAKKYHLPKQLIDFILEHHGTLLTRYQVARALQDSETKTKKLDYEKFRYPGPPPRSIETTVLMLADQSEARVRAEMPVDETQILSIIEKVIDFARSEGQLNDSSISFQQLSQIKDSFVRFLQNTYHPRIRYPDDSPKNNGVDHKKNA